MGMSETRVLLLSEGEAVELLSVKARLLRELRGRREIGFVRVGRNIRYRIEDIEEFIRSHAVGAR